MTRVMATLVATLALVLGGSAALATDNLQNPGNQDPPEQCWQQGPNGPVLGPCPEDAGDDDDGPKIVDPGHEDDPEQCFFYNEHGQLLLGPCPGGGDDGDEDDDDEDGGSGGSDGTDPNPGSGSTNPDVVVANPTFTG